MPPNVLQPSDLRDVFFRTFGKPEDMPVVREEIRAYWTAQDHITSPIDVYSHLIDARVNAHPPTIDRTRSEALKQTFRESFSPEHTTGLNPKHRGPLIDGMAELYRESFPNKPLYIVEGDIGNLGGINNAAIASARQMQQAALDHPDPHSPEQIAWNKEIEQNHLGDTPVGEQAAKLGRIKADAIIGTITGTVRGKLEEVAHVSAIRDGGDEIKFYVEPKPGKDLASIKTAMVEAQAAIDTPGSKTAFAQRAGLDTIPHAKHMVDVASVTADTVIGTDGVAYPKHLLVGQRIITPESMARGGAFVGLSAAEMPPPGPESDAIARLTKREQDARISEDKARRALGRSDLPPELGTKPAAMADINAALEEHAPARAWPRGEGYRVVYAPGETPEEARENQLKIILRPNETDAPFSEAEQRAIKGTIILTRKIDAVTGRPMFGNMQGEQLPNFEQNFGKAKMLHIDFSGKLAGGNGLNTATGNAICSEFSEAVRLGLDDVHMGNLDHYVATTQGGKFVLLVPEHTTPAELENITTAVQRRADAASQRALELHPDDKADALAQATKKGIPTPNNEVVMAAIPDPKTKLDGPPVVSSAMSAGPVHPELPLGPQLGTLELATGKQYAETVQRRLGEPNEHGTTPDKSGNPHQPPPGGGAPPDPAPQGGNRAATGPSQAGAAGEEVTAAPRATEPVDPKTPPVREAPPAASKAGPRGMGGLVAMAMSAVGWKHAAQQTGPQTPLDKAETGANIGAGGVGFADGIINFVGGAAKNSLVVRVASAIGKAAPIIAKNAPAVLGALETAAPYVAKCSITAVATVAVVGVVNGIVQHDGKKMFMSVETAAMGLAGFEQGAALGLAVGGGYGALAGGIVGTFAAPMGFDAVMNASLRPMELTSDQQKFFTLANDLPTTTAGLKDEGLKKLVEAKKSIIEAQTKLDTALKTVPVPLNPNDAREQLEMAENHFFTTYTKLGEDGLNKARTELTARLHPEVTAPQPSPETGALISQNTTVSPQAEIPPHVKEAAQNSVAPGTVYSEATSAKTAATIPKLPADQQIARV